MMYEIIRIKMGSISSHPPKKKTTNQGPFFIAIWIYFFNLDILGGHFPYVTISEFPSGGEFGR